MSEVHRDDDRAPESSFFFFTKTQPLPESRPPTTGPRPESVGPYRILTRLGQGGMGDVFLAMDETLSRPIAVKRLRSDRMSSDEFRRRFEVEARITARLQHPSIVPVYQYFREGSDHFYTMRPIEGVTLRELISRLRASDFAGLDADWPLAARIRAFLQAAGAIAYAHSKGVIHRDLKPANIMVGPFEEVLVLDWGIAKLVTGSSGRAGSRRGDRLEELAGRTTSAGFIGTPAYMAPEQLEHEAASYASDVFSLGIILHELLTLRRPWSAATPSELLKAMKTPPDIPARVHGQEISAELRRIVLHALERDKSRRTRSVADLARDVSRALEGRARWSLAVPGAASDRWSLVDGRIKREAGELVFRSRGPERPFRCLCTQRVAENVRVSFEFRLRRGHTELVVGLNARTAAALGDGGYTLEVVGGRRRMLSLRRSGRIVVGARSPKLEPRRWIKCIVQREDDRFSLSLDGEVVYAHHDPIPLRGGVIGLVGQSEGLPIRNLEVHSRGASAMVSCLAVPDAFFNQRLFEPARAEYDRIASSLPGRREGLLAAFRSGLCMLEMTRREDDDELSKLLLDEARETFARIGDESCLAPLGRAMAAGAAGRPAERRDALAAALEEHPDDPQLPIVREWLLGLLHSGSSRRSILAELLPLAMVHCRDDWGRRYVRDLVNEARREWEMPSFMTCRGRFRENDEISRAECSMFFHFWSGRVDLLERTAAHLARTGHLRAHHLEDAVFGLLELDPSRASTLLSLVEPPRTPTDRESRAHTLCEVAVHAVRGEADEGAERLAEIEPDVTDRAYNSARLWLARGFFAGGHVSRGLRTLRPHGRGDGFAREHKAWFALRAGDADLAETLLERFVSKGDHLSGRNLSNFLYGVTLTMRGEEREAATVFERLAPEPWPRTWTLGSHVAAGRLSGDGLTAWREEAFPWERRVLSNHVAMLELARKAAAREG